MENDIKLKAGKQSTEFIGKVIIQVVIAVNMVLNLLKLPSLDISPEASLAAAGAIEALWLSFRQWNKRLELQTKAALTTSQKAFDLEDLKISSRLREINLKHVQKIEEKAEVIDLNEDLVKLVLEMKKAIDGTKGKESKDETKD